MKTATLVVVGIAAGLVGIYLVRQGAQAVKNVGMAVVDTASQAAQAVNPLNNDNVFAKAGNATITAIVGKPETVGGWLQELVNGDPLKNAAKPRQSDAAAQLKNSFYISDVPDSVFTVGA